MSYESKGGFPLRFGSDICYFTILLHRSRPGLIPGVFCAIHPASGRRACTGGHLPGNGQRAAITVDELVGRTDLLKVKDEPTSSRAATLDLSGVLYNPYAKQKKGMIFNPKKVFDFELEKTLDEKVLVKQLLPALEKGQKRSLEIDVTNTDRTFGTIFDLRSQEDIRKVWKMTVS